MKILEVSKLYAPWVGGVEKIAQQISEGLQKKKDVKIEVLCCQSKGKTSEDKVNGVSVKRAGSWGVYWGMPVSFSFFKFFKNKIREADIVSFHHPFPLGDLAMLFFKPKKLIVHYHSDIVRQKFLSFLFKPLVLHTLKKADKIIVSNPNLIKSSPYLKRFKNKCEVIPFGVDFSKFKKLKRQEKIKKLKQKYGRFTLYVGRLSYYKGVSYLVEAMKNIDTNLIIVGSGDLKKKIKRKIKEENLEDKVHLLGYQSESDLVNLFAAAQVFVLPSIFKSEAFGIVLIEAMSQGTPLVTTELGTGTSWVNQNKKTGFVVEPKNSKELEKAIKKLLKVKNNQKMSQVAQKRAQEKFTLKRMVKKTYQAYKEVLNRE